VVITRPVGAHRALARAVRAQGGDALSLPGARIVAEPANADLLRALSDARHADIVVFQSPGAVRCLFSLQPRWRAARGTTVVAVGPGTARALARCGVRAVTPDRRHDSEGVLALAAFRQVRGLAIALVGAPGGRGLLAPALAGHGARVVACHVYRRVAPRYTRRHRDALLWARGALAWLVSSAEAVAAVRGWADPQCWSRLAGAVAVAPSERIAALLRAEGVRRVLVSGSAMPAAMLRTLAAAASNAKLDVGSTRKRRTIR